MLETDGQSREPAMGLGFFCAKVYERRFQTQHEAQCASGILRPGFRC